MKWKRFVFMFYAFAFLMVLTSCGLNEEDGSGLNDAGDSAAIITRENEIEIVEGVTYGSYVAEDVTVDGAVPGVYTFYVENGNDGFVELYRGGLYIETLNYYWQTTVTPLIGYTFDFTGISITVVKAGTGSINLYNMPLSIFDGNHSVTVESNNVEIVEGTTYGAYVVDDITVNNADAGKYTFYTDSGSNGFVELYCDGVYVETINYNWQTTVTPLIGYTFNFTDISITVVKAGTGSMNLYDMPESIFDGMHEITVE